MEGPCARLWGAGAVALWLVVGSGCGAFLGAGSLSDQDLQRAELHRDRAALKLGEGEVELAIREYQKALDLNPYDVESRFGFGVALMHKGLHQEAEAELREALRLAPDHHDARLTLSALHLVREEWEAAIQETTRLLEDPTFLNPARGFVNRAFAYYSSGDLDGAERDLREALDVDSSLFQAHLSLGIVLYDRGEIPESLQAFERVLSILDSFGEAAPAAAEAETRFRIAQARVKLGQRAKAVDQLRRASNRDGSGGWGAKARDYLRVLE